MFLQASLDLGRHPVLSCAQIQAELDLGAQLVDILSTRSGGTHETNFHRIFWDFDLLWDFPNKVFSVVSWGLLFGFWIIGNVFPRRYNLVVFAFRSQEGRGGEIGCIGNCSYGHVRLGMPQHSIGSDGKRSSRSSERQQELTPTNRHRSEGRAHEKNGMQPIHVSLFCWLNYLEALYPKES